jgi:hypothetical protein
MNFEYWNIELRISIRRFKRSEAFQTLHKLAFVGRYSILVFGLWTLFFDFPPTLVESFRLVSAASKTKVQRSKIGFLTSSVARTLALFSCASDKTLARPDG